MTQPTNDVTGSDYLAPINTQTWVNGRHNVRCVNVVQESWDVRTFCFMAEQPVMFFFKPGQFVTLELEINGEQVMRSYTISSSPSLPYSFSITVKRVSSGLVSNWLHDNMVVGSELAVHGPVGNFNCIDFPAEKVLLLSGGVGITPVMSMARWWFDTNASVDTVFIHSARTPRDLVYPRELDHMASRVEQFKLNLIVEKMENGLPWNGYRGFLDLPKLEMMAPDFKEREVFCCGPAPYMAAVRAMLKESGFDMARYHEESFGETPESVVEDAIENAEAAVIEADAIEREDLLRVDFESQGKSIQLAPNETLHTAAAKLDLHIPKACGMGICGTCKVKVIKGETNMEHNGGITDEDIDDGYVLSCCTTPQSDVVIDF
ncbi:2Fe-2S iron-sulfur cluster binding domain-containing protein [Marinomonas mediterranea]|uniref:Nitric oxide dioxygenase n=1 Tax=Marinomonas mediterranea (strain ATCC 700492 / JCM 21426 / NBRC 103028 / MMB-1) TaxID=717774 RepID=F2K0L7_MARM1|nr:hybrid-cluster NAD(P)-dependent oxidoreductase [Marinomonas mediterranea]ADZ91001.1 Nitric oxide dioxygenase [Marinomonas mediterranea MMB-1]WCN13071.1 2Fe-2S iron-sulfur cluster binding domain-containing protein [Marinomonas mediterranea]WCN17141.1 2Fe-2S iron-sulfur cluster binding domain-containing protein [Marinomonas mediterranea MMB-1]